MSFFRGGGSSNTPPQTAPYNRLSDTGSNYSLPSGPRGGARVPPPQYNDPSGALFEKRAYDRKLPPPRSGGRSVFTFHQLVLHSTGILI